MNVKYLHHFRQELVGRKLNMLGEMELILCLQSLPEGFTEASVKIFTNL